MKIRCCIIPTLLAAVCLMSPEKAWARAKTTTFQKMIEDSATIAVASYADEAPDRAKRAVNLEFLKILKGDFKPGKHLVSFQDMPGDAEKGTEFVVFLDKDKIWRFMANPVGGDKVDGRLLRIEGFNDFNAFIVAPGLVTLDQLQTYIKEKKLVYQFRGDIFFPQAKQVDWKAGTLTIKGTYDAIKQVAKVEGLPDLKGIASEPIMSVSGNLPRIDLEYSFPQMRSLSLVGKVDGVDPRTSELLVRFAVRTPQVLTQKAFEEYLADPKSDGPYYKFKLACTPTKDSASRTGIPSSPATTPRGTT